MQSRGKSNIALLKSSELYTHPSFFLFASLAEEAILIKEVIWEVLGAVVVLVEASFAPRVNHKYCNQLVQQGPMLFLNNGERSSWESWPI